VSETHDAQSWSHNEHAGFLSKTQTTDASHAHQEVSIGSTVAGDTVTGAAAHDLTIAGSTVAATHDVALAAGNNLTITTSQDTRASSTFHEEKKSGFGALSGGGLTLSYGTRDQKDTASDSSVTNHASLVGSTDGSVTLTAGNALHVTGSDLIAAQNITGTGTSVTLDAAQGATHHDETHEIRQGGLTLGLAGRAGDALNHAVSESGGVSRDAGSGDSRAAALHGIAAAGDAYVVGSAVGSAAKVAAGGNPPDIGVQVSLGSSSSRSDASEDQLLNRGSTVQAGATAAFVATGGDMTVAGSNVSAKDVVLAAKDRVNLLSTTGTDATRSSNYSSSASVGVSWTTGTGFGISASMQNAHGDANSDAAMQDASHVSGANSVNIISGGDTNLIGSKVSGNQVSAEIGGNLNIASVQDTTVSTAHQGSAGGGFSLSQAGGGASFSAQNGHAGANYAAVNEQAGILAGAGGFDINVRGNTDLKGAVIASNADASKNTLTTGTLTWSDLENHSHYSAASNGISAGAAVGITAKSTGPSSVSGSGGPVPMMSQDANGDQSATTRSAVSAGTIHITDGTSQKQEVASLSRDTTDINGTVSKSPDVNALLNQQADTMQAAQAAGQAAAQGIGAYADSRRDAALDTAQAALDRGDLNGAAAALADYKTWKEGGDARAGLHLAGGALIGGLGGGSVFTALGGAAGAGLSSKLAGQAKAVSDTVGDATGSLLIANISGNILSGLAGALIGGSAGAAMASNVNLYNQGHDDGDASAAARAKDIAQRMADALVQTATHPLDSLNYALNSILPAPGVKPDADPGPLIDANSGNRTPPTAGAVVTPPTMTCAPTGQCAMMPGTATPGTPGYVPYTATVSSGSHDGQPASSGTGGAATNSSNTGNGGAAANAVGAAREQIWFKVHGRER
jgi:filamentous hemagglutinin